MYVSSAVDLDNKLDNKRAAPGTPHVKGCLEVLVLLFDMTI